jgi:hypothetical protein
LPYGESTVASLSKDDDMEYIYETSKKFTDADKLEEDNEEEYDGDENLKEFGTSKFGPLASPYIITYIYNRRFLDK